MTEVLIAVLAVLVAVPMTVLLMNRVQAPLIRELEKARKPVIDTNTALQTSLVALMNKAIAKDTTAYSQMVTADREADRPHGVHEHDEQPRVPPEQLEQELARRFDAMEGNMEIQIP